ncbi:MAG TPA: hypothetical protein VF077_13065 [Nitrospiraceae bacterium]
MEATMKVREQVEAKLVTATAEADAAWNAYQEAKAVLEVHPAMLAAEASREAWLKAESEAGKLKKLLEFEL